MEQPKQYRIRPTVIEAMQWTGANAEDLKAWSTAGEESPRFKLFNGPGPHPAQVYVAVNCAWLDIEQGEWVAKGPEGFFPIKEAVFATTYEEVGADVGA